VLPSPEGTVIDRTVAYERAIANARLNPPITPTAECNRVMFKTGVIHLTPSFKGLNRYASVLFKDNSAVGSACCGMAVSRRFHNYYPDAYCTKFILQTMNKNPVRCRRWGWCRKEGKSKGNKEK
jgi:hypothetical protein